jgi:hypothetical protein
MSKTNDPQIEAGKSSHLSASHDAPNRTSPPTDLDYCPRCGQKMEAIVWGQTNCPRCGLHFECC